MKRFLVVVFLLCGISFSFAGSPEAKYKSLHQIPRGKKIGFRDQNTVAVTSGSASFRTMMQASNRNGNFSYFKLYFPPGTTEVSFLGHVDQSETSIPNLFCYVARMNQPPSTERVPKNISALPNDGFSLKQLQKGDCWGTNSAGYIFFVPSSGGLSVAKGGWLYVHLIPIQGNVLDIQSRIKVDVVPYLRWYKTASWDSRGDPVEKTSYPASTTLSPQSSSDPSFILGGGD